MEARFVTFSSLFSANPALDDYEPYRSICSKEIKKRIDKYFHVPSL